MKDLPKSFFKVSPSARFEAILSITCGCGGYAEYEVYEDKQPHCRSCMEDAVTCEVPVMVRRIG